MWTGLTLRQAPPRRPASYGRVEVLDHHALVAGGDGAVEEALGLVGVGGDDRREAAEFGHGCGEDFAARRERLVDEAGAGVEDVEEERLQAVAAPGTDARSASAPKSPIVSWKRRGVPVSSTPSTSPSSTRSPPGSARTTSTTPPSRSVTSFRLRV